MRVTLRQLRLLIAEGMTSADRKPIVDQLVKKYPFLKPFSGSLTYASAALIHPGSQGGVSPDIVVKAHEVLSTDPMAQQMWVTSPLRGSEFSVTSRDLADQQGKEKRNKESKLARYASTSLDVKQLRSKPVTSYTKRELYNAALATGHRLFDKHQSGLIWPEDGIKSITFERMSSYDRAAELVDTIGEDALDKSSFVPGTFEFVFFPSRPGKGVDASDRFNLATNADKLMDVDGNIYLADGDVSTITIMKPTIRDIKTYYAVVAKLLGR